jgi:hypothetical protein
MYSPFVQQPAMMPDPQASQQAWANGGYLVSANAPQYYVAAPQQYFAQQPQLPAGFTLAREIIQQFVINAWNAGQAKDDILDEAIACGHTRQEIAFIENLLDDLEVNYQPTKDEIEAYARKVKATFRKHQTSKALQALADSTPNKVLKGYAQKAADALKKAEKAGKVGSGNALETVDAREIILTGQVSVLIAGNSGSGKSCVANLICSDISYSPRITHGRLPQILVLDSHLNDWGKLPILHRKPDILRALTVACRELERRQEHWAWQVANLPKEQRRKDCWFYFIIILDEIGAIIAYANSDEGSSLIRREGLVHPSEAIRMLGSELRKFQGLFIGMNQSVNCDALGIDSAYRNNFVDIHLGKAALTKCKEYGWGNDSAEYLYLAAQAYACLVGRNVALHPTHYFYKVFAEKSPPASFPNAQTEPLSLMLPRRPISYDTNDNLYTGEVLPMREILQRYDRMIAEFAMDEEEREVRIPAPTRAEANAPTTIPTLTPPSTIANNTAEPSEAIDDPTLEDLWDDDGDDDQALRAAYEDIRQCRSQTPPLKKTAICDRWTGRTSSKLMRYDDALRRYAILWVSDYVQDGELTIEFRDLIELIWDTTPGRHTRERYKQCRNELGRILTALRVRIPWTQDEADADNNIVQLRPRTPNS